MFKSISIGSASGAIRVLPVFKDLVLPSAWRSISGVAEAIKAPGFKGDLGEVSPAGSKAILLGLGDAAKSKPSVLRRFGSRLAAVLERMGAGAASLEIPTTGLASRDPKEFGRAVAEGMLLGPWRIEGYDGKATERTAPSGSLRITSPDRLVLEGLADGLLVAGSVNYARFLQSTPPNVAHPQWMASQARALARRLRLKARVIDFAEARRLGMGGLVNVGMGSTQKPCLIILEHVPRGAAKAPHLAFVGKTLTYDTGGYSLKVNNGMKGMKFDKSGGCAVLGAIRAIAESRLPVRVTAVLPAAENMVAGDSFRPDDVISFMNGVTCEVTNTDAEGRLVLADALCFTCERIKPDAIVDLATLTGGVVVALGSHCAGYFCEDAELTRRIEGAADRSGEKVWRLPLWEEHRGLMRSRIADIVNSGAKRGAHPIQGAAFLSFFVKPGMPWAHVDIAGVSDDEGHELFGSGATGYGVRLLLELARSYADRAVTSRARGRSPQRPRRG